MKRNAFTLVELIFTIVIIGVLAAIAVPQYKQLQENAQIGNIVKYYSDIQSSAKSAYMNENQLNDVNQSTVDLTNLYDFKGKGWVISNSNDTATYTVNIAGNDETLAVTYNNAGVITMVTTIDGTAKTRIQGKLQTKTGMTFTGDANTTTLTLTE